MRLDRSFYERDVLDVAPDLIGKKLVGITESGICSHIITEIEAYGGKEDQASHARFGKTVRNSIMFERGGLVYMYLIYGMYWMMNIVTGLKDHPQAILIRGVNGIDGPGKITKTLHIDKSFHGEDLSVSEKIWLESGIENAVFIQKPRIGIDYAGEPWKGNPWRFIMVQQPQSF